MSVNTDAIAHLVGTSGESIETAVNNGLAPAGKTLRNHDWFKGSEICGHVGHETGVKEFQVMLKLGFRHDG